MIAAAALLTAVALTPAVSADSFAYALQADHLKRIPTLSPLALLALLALAGAPGAVGLGLARRRAG